jgi:ketosteroid isomerase-like protein
VGTKVDLVRDIYERFSRGDAPGILASFDDDIEFRLAEGHPYQPSGQPWRGKEAVTKHFFMKAGPEWDQWSARIDKAVETEDAVVVEGRYNGIYKPTGQTLDVQMCHVWRFRNGKINSFHQYVDTSRVQQVMRRK